MGLESIHDDMLSTHRQNIMNEYSAMQGQRTAKTGNPPACQGEPNSRKRKEQQETSEQHEARVAEHGAMRKTQREAAQQGIVAGPALADNTVSLPEQLLIDHFIANSLQLPATAPNAFAAQQAAQHPTPHSS